LQAPRARDDAAERPRLGLHRREIAHDLRSDEDLREAWAGGIGVDAGERAVKPRDDVAHEDVVVRAAVVPLLPERGAARLEPSPPAREIDLRRDLEEEVRASAVGEHGPDVLRAEHARVEVV